jgi:hypothetical protein
LQHYDNWKKCLPEFLGKLICELRKSKSAEQHSALTQDIMIFETKIMHRQHFQPKILFMFEKRMDRNCLASNIGGFCAVMRSHFVFYAAQGKILI